MPAAILATPPRYTWFATGWRWTALALLLCTTSCSGIYLGDNPGSDLRKESGPLVAPPAAVRNGTARDL